MDKYYRSEEFKEVLRKYEQLIENGLRAFLDSEEYVDVAEYYHLQGKNDKAEEVINKCLSIFPGSTDACAFMARFVMATQNDAEKANAIAEEIIDKSDIEYFLAKAEIMIADQRSAEADIYLETYVNEEMEDYEDYLLDIANMFADYQEWKYCKKWLQKSSLHEEDNYKMLLGQIKMNEGKYEECEQIFNELIDREPFSNEYWNLLAAAQFMDNDIKNSINSSEYAIAIAPNDEEAILNKANGLYTLGNYEDALKYYLMYCKLQPNSDAGELFTGITLVNLNRHQEAIGHLEKSLELALQYHQEEEKRNNKQGKEESTLLQTCQELIYLHGQLGNMDIADKYIDLYIQSGGDKFMADTLRGYIRLENKNTDEGLVYLTKAMKESEYSPDVILHVGIAAYDNGYIKEAYDLFNLLLQNVPEDWTEGYAYLARCCYLLENDEEYKNALKIAVKKNPTEARIILGDLYPADIDPINYPDSDTIMD